MCAPGRRRWTWTPTKSPEHLSVSEELALRRESSGLQGVQVQLRPSIRRHRLFTGGAATQLWVLGPCSEGMLVTLAWVVMQRSDLYTP